MSTTNDPGGPLADHRSTDLGERPVYPVGLVVGGRPCLVVGGGRVAARKVEGLLASGAAVTVVAPEVHEAVAALAASGAIAAIDESPLRVELRTYRRGEVAGYMLAVAATGRTEVDDAVFRDATEAGVWVNVADDVSRCSFLLPAVARRGSVSVAVSTGGASPALATWLRDRIVETIEPAAGELATLLAEVRRRLRERGVPTESVPWRTLLDGSLPALVRQGRVDEARHALDVFLAPYLQGPDPSS